MSNHNLARDKKSKAVVSIDTTGLSEYKQAKMLLRQKNNKISNLEERLSKLEDVVMRLTEKLI